jgi:hypothetical protein
VEEAIRPERLAGLVPTAGSRHWHRAPSVCQRACGQRDLVTEAGLSGRWLMRVKILVNDFEKVAVEDEIDLSR